MFRIFHDTFDLPWDVNRFVTKCIPLVDLELEEILSDALRVLSIRGLSSATHYLSTIVSFAPITGKFYRYRCLKIYHQFAYCGLSMRIVS